MKANPLPPIGRGRRWWRWLVGGIAVLVVIVAGGPFAYIHFIEGKAPAPLSLSSGNAATTTTDGSSAAAPATGTSATGSGIDGTWKVGAGSVAGYRIQETLFGQSNTAVGRTSAISGSITIGGSAVSVGQFSVDMTTVTSDRSQRDGQFQGRIMDTATYPTARFALTQPIQLGTIPPNGTTVTASATGKLTLHGTTRTVTFHVQARHSGATISVSGSIPIVFADYGINNPSGGPATTSDNGTLEFLLTFSHA